MVKRETDLAGSDRPQLGFAKEHRGDRAAFCAKPAQWEVFRLLTRDFRGCGR